MIKVGDTLPAVTLAEYSEVEGNGCSIGPRACHQMSQTTVAARCMEPRKAMAVLS